MKTMTVRAPIDLQKRLKEIANSLGYTRNGLVLQILHDWIDDYEKKTNEEKG